MEKKTKKNLQIESEKKTDDKENGKETKKKDSIRTNRRIMKIKQKKSDTANAINIH
jgi:hypothetical protein